MFHNRITHDGHSPAPAARRPAPDIADDAGHRQHRAHAAGVGFGALLVALPALLALMYYVRMPVNPDATELEVAYTSSSSRAFFVTTWSLFSILGALAAGAVLAGAVRAKVRSGAVRMLLTFAPAAVVGLVVAGVATLFGIDGDLRVLMAAQATLVVWCALALVSMLRITRGYTRRHERALALTTLVVFLVTVPLSHGLWTTIGIAFVAWSLLAASTQWYPRERATPPLSDAYAEEQMARRSPTEAEHLRFPLYTRR